MGDLLLGTPLIWSEAGILHLSLQLKTSDNLTSWTDYGGPVEFTAPLTGSKLFFRIRTR